jgi:CRP-like cAMP-binding protein
MSISGLFPIEAWDFNSQSILDGLDPDVYAVLTKNMTLYQYAKGEHLFKEGMNPVGIYYIKSGMVKKYKLDKDGREQIIYVANKGELVGYHAILADSRYPDSCAALQASKVGFIAREEFLHAIDQSPQLTRRLLKILSHEFGVMANSLSAANQRSVRERVALQLVVMREKFKKTTKEGEPIHIQLSREDLASMVGSARENIVRVITEMKSIGVLAVEKRSIIVLDVKRLVAIANV